MVVLLAARNGFRSSRMISFMNGRMDRRMAAYKAIPGNNNTSTNKVDSESSLMAHRRRRSCGRLADPAASVVIRSPNSSCDNK
jgi:hypothetical protein